MKNLVHLFNFTFVYVKHFFRFGFVVGFVAYLQNFQSF